MCLARKGSLKLTNVFAGEGSPSIQISTVMRHNESIEHKSACKIEEQAKAQIVVDRCEESPETEISVSPEDLKLFNTVYFTAKFHQRQ